MIISRLTDTNILFNQPVRIRRSRPNATLPFALLDAYDIALSVQVLQEFYVQATRATRRNALPHETAVGLVGTGCGELLSEDTSHGRVVEGVVMCDPFR